MYMIEITALDNGAHRNQSYNGVLPDGWALLPMNPAELENFPFGSIAVDYSGAQPVVTEWFAGTMPEEEDSEEETQPTIEERVTTLEGTSAEMTEALELILSGATEDET